MTTKKDDRPDPKTRKHSQLWQSYLWWYELVEMRKRHTLRLSSVERSKSNYDANLEKAILETMKLDHLVNEAKNMMIDYGEGVGEIWNWLLGIKGLGAASLAAQLLAQIDDISSFTNVSKLWRFAGYAVIDGKREQNQKGEKSHFNSRLKSICYLIGDQFIKQQTPLYSDIYYSEKKRQKELYPEVVKSEGKQIYNDGHLHNRAMRKMIKIFLQHLWLKWRIQEGLSTNAPYAQAILGHSDIIIPEYVSNAPPGSPPRQGTGME